MRYWDTSALVPLLVTQDSSSRMSFLAESDPAVTTWWGTPIECTSALARLTRDGRLEADALSHSMAQLRSATSYWVHVWPSDDLREQVMRTVRVHALRAGDALQLAAAIVASDFQPSSLEFVTLDVQLAEAATKEGFAVLQ